MAERVPGGLRRGLPGARRRSRRPAAARRGYFVEGLGAAQFALPGAVDRVRATATALERAAEPPGAEAWAPPAGRQHRRDGPRAVVLAATDPANPFGAALPGRTVPRRTDAGHRPGRKAGALVVLVDGAWCSTSSAAAAPCSPGPRTSRPCSRPSTRSSLAVREGHLGRLTVERADGAGVLDSPLGRALEEAGFHATPRGLRLRV